MVLKSLLNSVAGMGSVGSWTVSLGYVQKIWRESKKNGLGQIFGLGP